MLDDLISKKELLKKYDISYGALYRWKRMGLIPDEWFIKMAAPTGQETFFKKQAICERISAIFKMRDENGMSLDQIAQEFTQKQQDLRNVTIKSKYGSKTFAMDDIISITVSKNEKYKDIINIIKEIQL